MDIPHNLLHAIESQSAVLFLGAGASVGARHPQGTKIPSGDKLRDLLSDRFLGGALKDRSLASVAEFCVSESSLISVQSFIRDTFKDFEPAEFHNLIPTFGWHGIVGTNYDLIIERAYEQVGKTSVQDLVPFLKNGQSVEAEMKKHAKGVQYLKVHGCLSAYTDAEIPFILATEQYVKYATNRTRLFERLRDWGTEFPIVFCGYSIGDPNIQNILFDLFNLERKRPTYYVVSRNPSDIEERYWASHRIVALRGTFEDFLRTLNDKITPISRSFLAAGVGGGETSIRRHFTKPGVQESDRLKLFLSNDVDHVRRDMAAETVDPKEFYKGYGDGWGPIAQGLDIARSVTDSLVIEAILADERDRTQSVELFVLKGPGGNGKTISLKRSAWMAAHEYDKLVLYAKPGAALNPEVFEEIYDHVGSRFYLFVDRAAYYAEEIEALVRRLSAGAVKLTIVVAEREAEWNVRCERLETYVQKDFPVRYLSQREIELLVDKLAANRCLGLLENVDRDEQIRVFVERAQRQLLVALHEVTLGKPFEEIVFEEYHRIIPNDAQKLYLDICTLNRLGVEVRAGLISRISGITFTDFKSAFFRPLEYIVQSRMDKYVGDFVYSARHQRVAEMVFDRVLSDPERRFDQIIYIMDGMNIDYSSDMKAFSQLIRGRSLADSFTSHEFGNLIYEKALEVTGQEAFVLQQRAIFEMEHRGGSLSAAETYLSAALAAQPNNRSIKHSWANLLRRQALLTDDPLKKASMRQRARNTLKAAMGNNGNSAYGYHTAAQIALDQLKDVLNEADGPVGASERKIVDLAREFEDAMRDGLQRFSQNEHLLSLEASYRDLMKQQKRAEAALQSAFNRNPRLDFIAKRLARLYQDNGEIAKASTVLKKAVQENPSSKDAHFTIARFYMAHGSDAERALVAEHLRRAFTKGDSNFEAQLWYGRELFLRGEYDAAREAFTSLGRSSMPSASKNSIRGQIEDNAGGQKRFSGTVTQVEEGYFFIKPSEYPINIFSHFSRSNDIDPSSVKRDATVTFGIGFNAKGPAAIDVRTAD